MMRGTFGNIRIKNQMTDPKEGSWTIKYPQGQEMFVYEAARAYDAEKQPLVVIGGREYGTGSSRDWAAKGTRLLGVRAVLAESYERIHRNNLVGMGVLPLVFKDGQNAGVLGLDGSETYTIEDWGQMTPRKTIALRAVKADGEEIHFEALARLDTDVDVAYFENGGILPYVLRKLMAEG
jgi:aconitate hydratase